MRYSLCDEHSVHPPAGMPKMFRTAWLVLLYSLVASLSVSSASFAEDVALRPLFNGKDLSGWVLVNTPPQTWNVKDEMLVCTGKPIGEIRTEKMYQNFILEVEWRHMVPGGNAGIFVWADDITSKGVPFHRSIEVQVLENAYGQSPGHTTHGDIFPIHGATLTPVNGRGGSRAFPSEERSKPSPEWNHYRIECNDGHISLAVNGTVVTQGSDASPRKGYICIESEGGVVHYRNLKIRELPDSPVAEEHVTIANRGYRSVYTGLDLSGWKTTEAGLPHWQPNDWVLNYDGKAATPADAVLNSPERLSDHGFLFDVRPGQEFSQLSICGVALTADALKVGEWHRIEGRVQNQRLTLAIDGKPAERNHPVEQGLTFQLAPVGPADFANLYVRPLAPTAESK